jgi:hypothetical protein
MSLQENNVQASQELKTKEQAAVPQLEQSLSKLEKAGGFAFIENVIDGLANMNPQRKANSK